MTANAQPESTPIAAYARPQRHDDDRGRFALPTAEIERVAASVLDAARAGGASAAETEVSQAVGQSV